MQDRTKQALAEFQVRNCRGCYYADNRKVGTGDPCCTHSPALRIEEGKCLDRKETDDANSQ